DLVRDLTDRRNTLLEIAARVGRLAENFKAHENTTLAPAHDVSCRPAGLGVEDASRFARDTLDHWPRGRRGDFLVRGDESGERCRCAAVALEGLEHEGIHDKAGLHVGDAWPVGAAALDL